ncbi:MAG TPA: L-histidine N(alpha)-methyltransferase [Flavobacteriaceae bacterium]|nr:L-histidine N(alpha)-methyltransferase [Flavobacteriaceae bacterium]
MKKQIDPAETDFAKEVRKGLTDYPKHLSSKYIYDEKGDKLFQEIMDLPDYYLTASEFNILKKNTQAIAELFNGPDGFDLIELGAGDGKKTKILLRHLCENRFNFTYMPVDISKYALKDLEISLKKELPALLVKPKQGTYFKTMANLDKTSSRKKVIFMLGSNIGNLLHPQAVSFLKQIRVSMKKDDLLFMGFDLKKNPETILAAYNDKTGVTASFNKNILNRINRELGGNFDVETFKHWETYNPETGTAKSFLVSKIEQKARIDVLDMNVSFHPWESIHTEISQKYDDATVQWLAEKADLKIQKTFLDEKKYFKDFVFGIKQ